MRSPKVRRCGRWGGRRPRRCGCRGRCGRAGRRSRRAGGSGCRGRSCGPASCCGRRRNGARRRASRRGRRRNGARRCGPRNGCRGRSCDPSRHGRKLRGCGRSRPGRGRRTSGARHRGCRARSCASCRGRRRNGARRPSLKLTEQYNQWSAKYRRKAVYPWVLGSLNEYNDPALAEKMYREALKLDPSSRRAYNSLSLIDEVRGDLNASREDMRRAVEANPNDPSYLFYYARKFQHVDSAECTRLSLQVVERFPSSERAAQALYWLAADARDTKIKIHYLEILKEKFPPDKFNWSSSGMTMLFTVYDKSDRPRALALANEMVKLEPQDHTLGSACWLRSRHDRRRQFAS